MQKSFKLIQQVKSVPGVLCYFVLVISNIIVLTHLVTDLTFLLVFICYEWNLAINVKINYYIIIKLPLQSTNTNSYRLYGIKSTITIRKFNKYKLWRKKSYQFINTRYSHFPCPQLNIFMYPIFTLTSILFHPIWHYPFWAKGTVSIRMFFILGCGFAIWIKNLIKITNKKLVFLGHPIRYYIFRVKNNHNKKCNSAWVEKWLSQQPEVSWISCGANNDTNEQTNPRSQKSRSRQLIPGVTNNK